MLYDCQFLTLQPAIFLSFLKDKVVAFDCWKKGPIFTLVQNTLNCGSTSGQPFFSLQIDGFLFWEPTINPFFFWGQTVSLKKSFIYKAWLLKLTSNSRFKEIKVIPLISKCSTINQQVWIANLVEGDKERGKQKRFQKYFSNCLLWKKGQIWMNTQRPIFFCCHIWWFFSLFSLSSVSQEQVYFENICWKNLGCFYNKHNRFKLYMFQG